MERRNRPSSAARLPKPQPDSIAAARSLGLKDQLEPATQPAGTCPERAIWPAAAVCGFLLLAVVLVFGQTVGYDFVNYDDHDYVYENPHLARGLGAEEIHWAFTTNQCNNWHPLTWFSYFVDYQLYGPKPWGYHLTNVLLHVATAILLFLILWRLTGDFWPSAFVAAVFAVHPLRAESVAWVSERKDVLSGLFFMLTLGAYLVYARRAFSLVRYSLVAVLFALGLMAKPMLVTLPFVLLLLDYWPLGRMAMGWRLVVEKLPLLALSAASCVATSLAQSDAMVQFGAVPLSARLGNALVSYAAYLGQLFRPVGLAAFYPHSAGYLPIWQVAGASLLLAGICVAVVVWRRSCPYAFVGWCWYLGMLVPVIGLVQVGSQAMADRYTYLPQIGLVIGLAWGAKRALGPWPHRGWLCGVASALVLVVLMGCAYRQTSFWFDSETLWNRAIDCTHENAVAHYNLGNALADRGRVDEAIAHCRKALKIKPGYTEAHNNLGVFLFRVGRVDEAIAHCRKALEIKPDYADPHCNLAMILTDLGRFDEAVAHCRQALESKPDFAEAYNNLGLALAGRGRVEEAIRQYEKALEVKPDFADPHCNLALILINLGRFDEAVAHCRQALESKPNFAEAYDNLGLALAAQGRVEEAIRQYEKALEIKPDFADAHNSFGVALAGRGRLEEAIAHFQAAAKIKPDYAEAHNNLANALANCGQIDEAIVQYQRALEVKPDYTNAHNNLGIVQSRREGILKDLTQRRESLRSRPNDVALLNETAWILATNPNASIRNGTEAVELAQRAVQLSDGREAAIVGTLAAAYAEAGRFSEAVQTARQALELAGRQNNQSLAESIKAKIPLYERGNPFREIPQPSHPDSAQP
jgi:protein O-mannosyl-transferase